MGIVLRYYLKPSPTSFRPISPTDAGVTPRKRTNRPTPNSLELRRYAAQVAVYYWAEHERVAGLAAKDWVLWEELHRQLLKRAYHALYVHIGLPQPVAFERANDYAQKACELIFRGRYPFDVPFLAWATRVLTNCIYAGEGRSTDLLDRGTFVEPALTGVPDLEWIEEMYWLEDKQDIRRWEDRELLWEAIQHLPSQLQRQVIIQDFLCGQSSAEIAQELDKTTQAVYNLRHRALAALREILEAQWRLRSGACFLVENMALLKMTPRLTVPGQA